jgi:4,5-dihydroxyphthalate decarboxylase
MSGLQITLACSPSDRSRPVLSGEVPIEGCAPELMTRPAAELLRAAAREMTYDITEMSMSSHLVLTARETPHYVAVPAFHSRLFRHSSIYINTASGITRPEDLAGKRVGVQEYQQTAALWVRGMLSDDYGVDAGSILWRTGGVEKPGGSERVPIKLPDRLTVEPIGPDKTLSAMLIAGEIDALISPRQPSAFDAATVERLFPDYRKVEKDYYKRTRLFPIMHGIGVRRSLAEKDPWLPGAVYAAFCEGRRRALEDLAAFGVLRVTLPWVRAEFDAAQALMGSDFWPYGFEPNLPELTAMARFALEQGLADRVIDRAEMFHPSVLGAETDPWRDPVL